MEGLSERQAGGGDGMVPAGLIKGVKDSNGPETRPAFLVVRGQGSHLLSEAHVTRQPMTSGVFRADLECGPVHPSNMYDAPPHCRQASPRTKH